MFKGYHKNSIRNIETAVEYYQEENGKSGYALYKPYSLLPWYQLLVWVSFTPDAAYPVVYAGKQSRLRSFWGKPTDDRIIDMFREGRSEIITEWFV